MNTYELNITNHIAQLSQYRINHNLPEDINCQTAGRMLSLRVHRNIIFFDLHEDGHYIQCGLRSSVAPEAFQYCVENISRGNMVWVEGQWAVSNSGEVTLFVNNIHLISQNLDPIGDLQDGYDAMAGRTQRDLDLMLNRSSMERFQLRSQIIWQLRQSLNTQHFMEVETPILQTVASGAQATPFQTHIQATNSSAYLRIAPETYLVRLLAGGMSRIFEIGHNFRNEGISARHNPEFSMLEFYETFTNLETTMNLTQQLITQSIALNYDNLQEVIYGDMVLDFTHFYRFSISEALSHFLSWSEENVNDRTFLLNQLAENHIVNTMPSENISWLQYMLFDHLVEHLLIQPTFITNLPIEASPLAYSSDGLTTHRFELFCAGRELANGFEQVLSYAEQIERFEFQAQIAGRDNAMEADQQYLSTLRYGLPSLSGCGIGIDRLVMLATNSQHIRDVILYPL
jgi:lysyl-tRNA synthetase class 2